jgi:methyl-accepting chemotaxis protein
MTRTKRNWFDAIRKFKTDDASREDRYATEAQLWQAHEAAKLAATALLEDAAHLVGSISRERTTVDALSETVRGARSRSDELTESQNRVAESFDRLRLVALNLGLEGARLGDSAGKSLISVADEVRLQADRGSEALNDLRNLHSELVPTLARVDDRIGQLRQSESQVSDQVTRIQENAQLVSRHVDDLLVWARKLSETDPETARIVARAIDHARGLLSALSALREKAQLDFAMNALRPILVPLVGLLGDMGTSSESKKD